MNDKSNITTKTLSSIRFPIIVTGCVLSIMVAALDETIVSAVSPDVMRDFLAFDKLGWIGCTFLLAVTVFQPFLAKLCEYINADIVMLFCLLCFGTGSILCGLSKSITMFIVSRGILGTGTSGLFLLPFVTISSLVTLNKRGIYIACFEAIFCLSNLLGPIFGTVISKNFGWRMIFFINVALVSLAVASIIASLSITQKKSSTTKSFSEFDIIGSFLLTFSISLILLGASLDKREYPWRSPTTISFLLAGIVGIVVLMRYEFASAKDPIFPKEVFVWNTLSTITISFVIGFMFYIMLYYIPFYYKSNNYEYNAAAIKLTYLLLSSTITLPITGALIGRLNNYKIFLVMGTLFIAVGTIFIICDINMLGDIFINMVYCLIGMGFGFCFHTNIIAAQTALSQNSNHVSSITSILSFFLALGGTFGIALANTVFDAVVQPELERRIDHKKVITLLKETDKIKEILIDERMIKYATKVFNQGFKMIYIFCLPFAVLGLLSAFMLKNIKMENHHTQEEKPTSEVQI